MEVTFYGVRGSCPSPSEANRRYGGNTASVALLASGHDPIMLDMGTGLRRFGETQPCDGTFRGSALVTHLHWDHVQGLPFFPPVDRVGAHLDVYGPSQVGGSLAQMFDDVVRPPYFPVRVSDLRGTIAFHEVDDEDLAVGDAKVRVRQVPHTGPTVGYRIERDGAVVVYISDHQEPIGSRDVADSVIELADGADLLIHDAQYRPDEFAEKAHWGHCTAGYALRVAQAACVRTVALFHHDPSHGDDEMDRLLDQATQMSAACGGPEVIAAYEGLCIAL
ncbi:MAG TPA: MBL fold metallo-hydrolase [Acidimicrobiales bacterium]|nr:MBL fold metallo-hydrolase [Acidimicrobiales bacterium]